MNGPQRPVKTRVERVAELLTGLPLPPEGINTPIHRLVWEDPKTGDPLGAIVMWCYGPISAFLGAKDLRQAMYDRLPEAAQILVDWEEDLSSAASNEAQQAVANHRRI